ncbi:hypothetical protein ACQJBY_066438 [Aegilops geniculata]
MPRRAAAASTPRRLPPRPRSLQPHLPSTLILRPRRGALLWTRRRFTHLRPPLRGSLCRPPSPMQSTPVASPPPPPSPSSSHGMRESRRRPWQQGRPRRPQPCGFLSLMGKCSIPQVPGESLMCTAFYLLE